MSPPSEHPTRQTGVELTLAQQSAMVDALQASLQAEHRDEPVQRYETHISFVLVAGGRAYKLKKAVTLDFLDFGSLSERHRLCLEELRLNRRLAPSLYLDVVPVTGTWQRPRFGGDGPMIDAAVAMRAFPQQGLWDRMAARGELHGAHVDALAAQLLAFHREAAVAGAQGPLGHAAQVRQPMLDNLQALAASADACLGPTLTPAALAALREWEAAEFAALAPVFEARLHDGFVREGHGDLHLGNVAMVDGRVTVFDCIEFNEAFRWGDVVGEIAFLAMDLHAHGLPALAHRFVDACLEGSGDHAGARVLRWYLVYRALVRAKVAVLRAGQQHGGDDGAVQRYLALAAGWCRAPRPVLMITHGFSGSGKTTGAQAVLEAIGAVRIRADVERKRLFGLGSLDRSGSAPGAGLYSAEATAATYAQLLARARPVLAGGHHVILDAAFLSAAQRADAQRFASSLGVQTVILSFEADVDTLLARLLERTTRADDASEADAQVLALQTRTAQPLSDEERMRTVPIGSGGVDGTVLDVLRLRLALAVGVDHGAPVALMPCGHHPPGG
ncbi:bifunctional aminoglycoside phosphotransferase/ATP-binding protein [Ideonella sp. A 288]|uniref:bifunctional aminoglycoside phosphotransferase/ATP-binding protein n=1 Tax=Ideonella sp. A 288 TaxID=1962181 RepID=UPI000B4B4E11|nr:bifunctional aminoglycoside phosphotransferase/ATP-binding protein [Ideonella sp. A 288]